MPKEIVVYTQPGCSACERQKEFLASKGVTYELRDISKNREHLDELITLGFNATPVTLVDGEAVAGFNPKKLEELLSR
jgi:glutaredoxin